MKKNRPLLFVAAYAAIFFATARAEGPAATMIPEGGDLQPGTTLEFRFAQAVVAPDQIGPASVSPVVFEPELPGQFVWLSTRSGVFSPRGPLPLGRTWRAALREGVPGTLDATVRTPPFAVTKVEDGVWDEKQVSPDIAVRIAFNLPVAADASFFEFVNGVGAKIPADVRAAKKSDYFTVAPEEDDWNMRWKLSADPAAKTDAEDSTARLIVTPAAPLGAADGWTLVVKAGLPSADGSMKLGEAREIPLGTVPPFEIRNIECGNYVNSGPTANISFSTSLAPDITPETAGTFFTITPKVDGLAWEMSYDTAVARGRFALGTDYTLRIGEDVVSAAGQAFSGAREVVLRFNPVPPRLYLPELTMAQILGGRRLLPVRSVNLQSLRIRAKLLAPDQAARAMSVFKAHQWKYAQEQPIPSVDFTGELIFDEKIQIADAKIDKRELTELDWNRILGGRRAGVVYLELNGQPLPQAGGKPCGAQALVQLTDLGVLWQKAGRDLDVFVFSTADGKPVAGAKAGLLGADFATGGTATTDAQGNARLSYRAVPEWLVVQAGGDTCLLRMGRSAEVLPVGAFFADWEKPAEAAALRGMIFTDRPLYQPGEIVRIKGFLREITDAKIANAASRQVDLKLRDAEFNEVASVAARTDAQGAFDTEVELPGAPLGRYGLSLEVGGTGVDTESLIVAAYQPDAFEVDLDIADQFPAGAAAPSARVAARYFFGGKVTDAEVRWSLRYLQSSFSPEGFGDFAFLVPREEEAEAEGNKPLTLRGDGLITGGAPLEITPPLPDASLAPFRGALTAEVTDLNQQTVSRTAEFTRQSSDFYLGLSGGEQRVVGSGSEVPLQVVAVKPDGKPLEEAVDVTVKVWRWRYNVVRQLGAGGAMTFRTETIEEPVLEKNARTLVPEKSGEKWTCGDNASLRIKPQSLGHHRVRVSTRDAAGREVVSETSFYVAGEGNTVWDYRSPNAIDLIPDKTSYQPGETARILVKTPIEGTAVVSVVRGDTILRSMRMPLGGNAPVIEIPVADDDAPNVSVTLVILRGADASPRKFPMPEFRFGNCTLRVDRPQSRLQVAIEKNAERVAPGEEVSAVVAVRDDKGNPVRGAGVTFYAVDDGVLALAGFKRPDPATMFLQPVADRVLTGLSLAQLLPEDPADLEFANKGYLIGGGGEGGPIALRENFPGTAVWLPSLATDADGRVTARFAAPDALTRYRLVAVAAAQADAFGAAESAVAIAKPLMLLPSLGQFANEGDQLVARAVIRNETGADGDADVTLRTPAGTQNKTVRVAQGSSAAADFSLSPTQPGEIALEWTARMTANGRTFTDGAKTLLPVGSPMVKLRETYFARIDGTSANLLEGINPQLTEGRGDVAVTVANTRLASLGRSARYLVEYPYGCAEQKTSALVPWIVMPVLGPFMPEFARPAEETERVKNQTIVELFELQAPDGGLGFWPGETESALFPSAWAAVVLSAAEAQGTKLPRQWNRLLEYLAKSLRGLDEDKSTIKLSDRAFAAYALALARRAEPSYHEELFRRRADLPRDARAVLALAIALSDGPREMAARLLSPREPAPDDTSPFGDAVRERAIRLLALTAIEPRGKEMGALVAELLKLGAAGASATTQNSAWTLLALASYQQQVEGGRNAPRDARGAIVAGEESAPFAVSRAVPAVKKIFAFTPGAGASQKLEVANPSAATLYGETTFDVFPPLGDQPRQDRGFAVSRTYRKIAPDGSLQPAENLRVGDRIVVTIRVETTRPARFVAIDDPLPSVLEAVNPEFVSRASGETDALSTAEWVSHSETRADRVLYFCDVLPAGAHTYEYLARVRVAGEATAGATRAEAMYRPERFGLGTTARLSSEPALNR